MTTFKSAAATADVTATLQETRAAIDVALLTTEQNDLVLAWENGLAVCFKGNDPVACGVLHAEAIVTPEQASKMPEEAWGFIPNVVNGHGETARLLPRGTVLARERASVANLLEQFAA